MNWPSLDNALSDAPMPPSRFRELYVSSPYAPADQIVGEVIRWSRQQGPASGLAVAPHFVFCGARGSGKSTELLAVQTRLATSAEVLRIDLGAVLPPRSSLAQVLAFAGLAVLARLREWEGEAGEVERAIQERDRGFIAALEGLGVTLSTTGALTTALAPLVTAADQTGVLHTLGQVASGAGAFLGRFRETVIEPLAPISRAETLMRALAGAEREPAQQLVIELSRLAGVLNGLSAKPVVILIDGLDKGRSLDNLLDIFGDGELLRSVEVPIILTGPTALRHEVRFAGLRQVAKPLVKYNFPVVDQSGVRREDGIAALLELLNRRLGASLAGAVTAEAADCAALNSSGIPREFLKFLGRAASIAEGETASEVSLKHVLLAVKETRLLVQQSITEEDLRVLDAVRQTARIRENDRVYALLDQNIISTYPNDNAYFQPAVLLASWVKTEVERLRPIWKSLRES